MGYLIALKISFSYCLKKAYTKNGIEEIIAVEANGSFNFNEIKDAKITNTVDIDIVIFLVYFIAKVVLLFFISPLISGISVKRATAI